LETWFYIKAPDSKRKLKVQTFDSVKYPTERDVRKAVEGQMSSLNAGTLGGKVAATLGDVIDRYMKEEFPSLRHSTQATVKSLIDLQVQEVPKTDAASLTCTWTQKRFIGTSNSTRQTAILAAWRNKCAGRFFLR
jgi:hypothetical protein